MPYLPTVLLRKHKPTRHCVQNGSFTCNAKWTGNWNSTAHQEANGYTNCSIFIPCKHKSVIKKDKLLVHAIMWINLSDILLSGRSQTKDSLWRSRTNVWSYQLEAPSSSNSSKWSTQMETGKVPAICPLALLENIELFFWRHTWVYKNGNTVDMKGMNCSLHICSKCSVHFAVFKKECPTNVNMAKLEKAHLKKAEEAHEQVNFLVVTQEENYFYSYVS